MLTRRWSVAASVSIVALGVLSYRASANLSTEEAPAHDSGTGSMALSVGAPGSTANRLSIASSDLAPGDTVQRQLVLTVANGEGTMDALALTTAAGSPSPPSFVTDAGDGLQLWIAVCDQEWSEAGTGPSYTYTCPGTARDVLGSSTGPVPVLQGDAELANLTVDDGALNRLRVQLELPPSAPSSMQGQSETITFRFTGIQRSGANR